jgi:hypothetical protein
MWWIGNENIELPYCLTELCSGQPLRRHVLSLLLFNHFFISFGKRLDRAFSTNFSAYLDIAVARP